MIQHRGAVIVSTCERGPRPECRPNLHALLDLTRCSRYSGQGDIAKIMAPPTLGNAKVDAHEAVSVAPGWGNRRERGAWYALEVGALQEKMRCTTG